MGLLSTLRKSKIPCGVLTQRSLVHVLNVQNEILYACRLCHFMVKMIKTVSKSDAWQHILGLLSIVFAKGSFVTSAAALSTLHHTWNRVGSTESLAENQRTPKTSWIKRSVQHPLRISPRKQEQDLTPAEALTKLLRLSFQSLCISQILQEMRPSPAANRSSRRPTPLSQQSCQGSSAMSPNGSLCQDTRICQTDQVAQAA